MGTVWDRAAAARRIETVETVSIAPRGVQTRFRATVQFVPEGVPNADAALVPGDIGLVCDKPGSVISDLIQAGERAEYGDTSFTEYTHEFLIETAVGGIIEAEADGVSRGNVSKYDDCRVAIISPATSPGQRALAVAFASAHVGDEYGVVDFVSLALRALLGWKLAFHASDELVCSEMGSRSTEKYVVTYHKPPETMMPSDTAYFWSLHPDEAPLPVNFLGRLLDKVRAVARALSPFG